VRRSATWLVVLAAAVPLIACTVGTNVSGTVVTSVDLPLPTLSGKGVQGSTVSSQTFAGKVLVVNAWAHWCGPCHEEQPALVQLADRFRKRGVAFLGINHQDDRNQATAWIEQYHVPYPSIWDPSGRMAAELGYVGLPDTYVVDRTGMIRYIVTGPTNAEQLTGLIDDVLAEPSSSASASASGSGSAPSPTG
jgi:DsbE subfamily thiol:disulfide oxidoreductase